MRIFFLLPGLILAWPELTFSQDLDRIRNDARSLLVESRIPVCAYGLFSHDSILLTGDYGLSRTQSDYKLKNEPQFRIGSITKTFTALGILKLIENEQIRLDDPIKKYLPEIPLNNRWEDETPVQIVHLLGHSAGLDDMHLNEYFSDRSNPNPPLDSILIHRSSPFNCRWKPGICFSYSNPGYTFLGAVIEKVSGQTWEKFLQDSILRPIGIEDVFIGNPSDRFDTIIIGFANPEKTIEYQPILHRPSGSMMLRIEDLCKLGMIFLGKDSLLFRNPQTIRMMEKPVATLAADAGLKFGYGLGIYSGYSLGRMYYGHEGMVPGFISMFRYFPEDSIGFAFISGCERMPDSLVQQLERLLVGWKLIQRNPLLPCAGINTSFPSPGYYRFVSVRNEITRCISDILGNMRIRIQGQQILLSGFMEHPDTLISCGNALWRKRNEPEASFVFGLSGGRDWIVYQNHFYLKTAAWKSWAMSGFFLLYILLILLNAFLFIGGFIHWMRGSMKGKMKFRWIPGLLALGGLLLPQILLSVNPYDAVKADGPEIALMVWSVAIPLLSFAGLFLGVIFKKGTRQGRFSMFLWKSMILTSVVFSIGMAYYGLVGIRLWHY